MPSVVTPKFLRSRLGSGKIFDDSEVCSKTFLDRRSAVSNGSSVWMSRITGSQIKSSTITGALVEDSWIESAFVSGGTITRSLVACELVSGLARIEDSRLTGRVRVSHNAKILGCTLTNITVCGNAVLKNLELDASFGYVSRGVWDRVAPRCVRLKSDLTLTESVDGCAYIGCLELPIAKWIKGEDRYRKIFGLSKKESGEIRLIFKDWLKN